MDSEIKGHALNCIQHFSLHAVNDCIRKDSKPLAFQVGAPPEPGVQERADVYGFCRLAGNFGSVPSAWLDACRMRGGFGFLPDSSALSVSCPETRQGASHLGYATCGRSHSDHHPALSAEWSASADSKPCPSTSCHEKEAHDLMSGAAAKCIQTNRAPGVANK